MCARPGRDPAAHLRLGAAGEDAAAEWYRRRGFSILARNWRCREGELDLVLRRDDLVVICEVKTRSSDRRGGGAAAVGPAKQRRIRTAALRFLDEHRGRGGGRPSIRFDVAVVRPRTSGMAVEVLEGAF
jgi:putative endonuclease